MSKKRQIDTILKRKPVMEGAGVRLHRVFGFSEAPNLDPFLLLDDFRSDRREDYIKGFPWHPHRGIETITYVLKGDVAHGDSLGNEGVISSGDVQWMTAGSGIIHQEMPQGDADGAMYGFQLWANLPAAQKMMEPRYREITAGQIPNMTLDDGVSVKVIAGTVAGTTGPVTDIVIDPQYLDCSLPPETSYTQATEYDHTLLIYIIGGQADVDGTPVDNGALVLFGKGDTVRVDTKSGARFLLLSGQPLNEPVAWRGPIVMNTQAELDRAFREYRENTFIKHQQ
jgi:redox-sensitive bicupin YhaK (pirin superfamily)